MYVIYYGNNGSMGAECGRGSTIAAAQQNALMLHNVDLPENEQCVTFEHMCRMLHDTDMYVLTVRVQ